MKKRITLLGYFLFSLLLSGCPQIEIQNLPIEADDLDLTSYYGTDQTRSWVAEHVKIYDDYMVLEETIIREEDEKNIVARELTVPLYRGAWSGLLVSITQKELSMQGDIFTFDERTGILTLENHVEILREKMKVYGEKLSYDNRTDIMELDAPSGFLS